MTSKSPAVKSGLAIRKHAMQLTAALLRRLAYEVSRASLPGNADAVHDLRVSIRRLAQCLRLFRQFFPRAQAKAIRRCLKELMARAAGVRNRDVALELLVCAGIPATSPLVEKLSQEREREHRRLVSDLEVWTRHGFSRKWRAELEL